MLRRHKKRAVQIPIVAVLSVAPAIVAGGETENVPYLNHRNTPRKRLLAVKDRKEKINNLIFYVNLNT